MKTEAGKFFLCWSQSSLKNEGTKFIGMFLKWLKKSIGLNFFTFLIFMKVFLAPVDLNYNSSPMLIKATNSSISNVPSLSTSISVIISTISSIETSAPIFLITL